MKNSVIRKHYKIIRKRAGYRAPLVIKSICDPIQMIMNPPFKRLLRRDAVVRIDADTLRKFNFTPQQLEGIIAHEFGHLDDKAKGHKPVLMHEGDANPSDRRKARNICRRLIYVEKLFGEALSAALAAEAEKQDSNLAIVLRRYRMEFMADAYAVRLCGHDGIAQAFRNIFTRPKLHRDLDSRLIQLAQLGLHPARYQRARAAQMQFDALK